jgi:hypothetical protein
MNVPPPASSTIGASAASRPPLPSAPAAEDRKLRETFESVVGQTLFGQMLHSMRKTVGKPAYFHGGRTEEVFQQQLDRVLAEKISQASADRFTGPMYELFALRRS